MKLCTEPGCKNVQFGGKKCTRHQNKRTDKKPPKEKKKYTLKKTAIVSKSHKKSINKKSARQKKEEDIYRVERLKFLALPENQYCAVYPHLRATQIHHKRGREGKRLNDKRYWLGVSDEGHKRIEANPEEAYQNGWTESRLLKIIWDIIEP